MNTATLRKKKRFPFLLFGPVLIRREKYHPFNIVYEKKKLCHPRVFKHFEYVELKNNYFLQQELHHTKLLYYSENVAKLYEIRAVLLMKKNANLSVIFV